jgi:hypothetical protein
MGPLGLLRALDPDQLKVGVGEKETPARGPLARVPVGLPLAKAQRGQVVRFGTAGGHPDEQVIQFNGHEASPSSAPFRTVRQPARPLCNMAAAQANVKVQTVNPGNRVRRPSAPGLVQGTGHAEGLVLEASGWQQAILARGRGRRSAMNDSSETVGLCEPNTRTGVICDEPECIGGRRDNPSSSISFWKMLTTLCRPVLVFLDYLSQMPHEDCDRRFGHFHPSRGQF